MILGKWPTWRTILFYVFISVHYMFRATSCSSSGESIVSIQHLVYVTLCQWPFRMQVGKEISDLHTERSSTQNDTYQMLYWHNWFSWWWARGCSKHVENWNKYIEKNCAWSWSFTKNLSIRFPHQNSGCNSHLSHACHMPHPSLIVKAFTGLRQTTKGKSINGWRRTATSMKRRTLWDL